MAARDHFLPIDLERVVEDLLGHPELPEAERAETAHLFSTWIALFQLDLSRDLRTLRTRYHPFDPDAETVPPRAAPARGPDALAELCGALREVLARANFRRVSPEALEAALNKTSPRGVRVEVDLEEFDVLEFHVRGAAVRRDTRRVVRGGKVVRQAVETPVHRRLLVFAKLRGEDSTAQPLGATHVATDEDRPRHDRLYVKLFRDVAHTDLEMMLPNTRVRMTVADKVKLSVTGGGGTVGGLVATLTKVGAAASPITWGLALAGFGGVVWRQVTKLVHTRTRYAAALARKLYTRSLDSNFGAIARVVELAQQEECKEALLAWFFLVRRGSAGASAAELDADVEQYLKQTYDLTLDFEVGDGVRKLEAVGLCSREGERLRAPSAQAALPRVRATFDARL